MFLVYDNQKPVFFHKDPRHEGYSGKVEENVVLYFPDDVDEWPDGERRPQIVVGVSPQDEKLFQVFRFEEDCRAKGYRKVWTGAPHLYVDWQQYLLKRIQSKLMPEHAREHIAINLQNGEYVLGKTAGEAFGAFVAKWPKMPMYKCRVDGSPSVKLGR